MQGVGRALLVIAFVFVMAVTTVAVFDKQGLFGNAR
jgi:hypothetical protein